MNKAFPKRMSVLLAMLLLVAFLLPGCTTTPAEQETRENVCHSETMGTTEPSENTTAAVSGEDQTATEDALESTEAAESTAASIPYGENLEGTLRVVTDEENGMLPQLDSIIRKFETFHPNVTVEVEYLPYDDTEAREIALDQLRTAIMAGKGPDIYLLPTSGIGGREPLFFDVNQSMRNGLFADISELYDGDTALETDKLNKTVMDTGVLDGVRYVLPLRFNIPVAYVDIQDFEAAGLSTDIFNSDMAGILDAVAASKDPLIAAGAFPLATNNMSLFYYFPEFIDYDNEEILLTAEELVTFLESYKGARILQGQQLDPLTFDILSLDTYATQSMPFWANDGYSLAVADLDKVLEHAAIAKAEGIELGMYPIKTSDGSLVADVTYFGAIDGYCENPGLAYAFLREFLTEESQWEQNVYATDSAFVRLSYSGYPVRVTGSVSKLYSSLWDRIPITGITSEEQKQVRERKEQLNIELTNDDIPVLQATIDKARFPISNESVWSMELYQLYDWSSGKWVETDIDGLAEEIIDELFWHLFEG